MLEIKYLERLEKPEKKYIEFYRTQACWREILRFREEYPKKATYSLCISVSAVLAWKTVIFEKFSDEIKGRSMDI